MRKEKIKHRKGKKREREKKKKEKKTLTEGEKKNGCLIFLLSLGGKDAFGGNF